MLATKGLSVPGTASFQPTPSTTAALRLAVASARADRDALTTVSTLGLPPARAPATSRGLASGTQARAAHPAKSTGCGSGGGPSGSDDGVSPPARSRPEHKASIMCGVGTSSASATDLIAVMERLVTQRGVTRSPPQRQRQRVRRPHPAKLVGAAPRQDPLHRAG